MKTHRPPPGLSQRDRAAYRVGTAGLTAGEARGYKKGFLAGRKARRKHRGGDCVFWAGEYLRAPSERFAANAARHGVQDACRRTR